MTDDWQDELAWHALRLSLAGIPAEVQVRHALTARRCAPFADAHPATEPLIRVRVSEEDVGRERVSAPAYSDAYLELTALHRLVAEAMPPFDRLVFHACVVEFDGRAYAFTAPSGTGKSTHAGLWMRCLGEQARVLNGDKPFLHVPVEGPVEAWGSPWTGKEGWGYAGHAPLAGICVLHQAPACSIARMQVDAALEPLMRQCYIPQESPAAALAALACVDRLLARVGVWQLGCTISEEAVRLSFEAMTGRSYEEHRRSAGA